MAAKKTFAIEVIVLLLVVAVISFFLMMRSKNDDKRVPPSAPQVSSAPRHESSEMNAPDGKRMLSLSGLQAANGMEYLIKVIDKETKVETIVFNETLPSGVQLKIPFNTWSVNGKHFFLEANTAGVKNFWVFSADGKDIATGTKYFDMRPLFEAKKSAFTMKEATGWDSNTLITFSTIKEDGTAGPRYWFEIPSKAFIQLAH